MFFEEELPRKKSGPEPLNLEPLSIAELEEYILWLCTEEKRTHAEIARKKKAAQAAEQWFKP